MSNHGDRRFEQLHHLPQQIVSITIVYELYHEESNKPQNSSLTIASEIAKRYQVQFCHLPEKARYLSHEGPALSFSKISVTVNGMDSCRMFSPVEHRQTAEENLQL